jgi:hypothetical protein
MFPSTVRSRIMGDDGAGLDGGSGHAKPGNIMGGSGHSKQAKGLSGPSTHSHGFFGDKSNVIADFYPEATVLCTYQCSSRCSLFWQRPF